MSGNADSDLDKYVAGRMEQYYGSDVVRAVSSSLPPPPPDKRPGKFRVLAASLCAAAFLTGAVMVTGVLFSSRVPISDIEGESVSSESASAESESVSSATASAASESVSSATASAASENVSSATASAASENVSSVTASAASENVSSVTASAASENVSSESVSSASEIVSSEVTDTGSDDNSGTERDHEYVLPDAAEQTYYIIESEAPSPNGSVTTGRSARAGVGVFLMLASLCGAAILYKEKLE